ncbi:MAG: hypothetical protein AB7F50_00825 [Fimbriimonadaceae bacterium]
MKMIAMLATLSTVAVCEPSLVDAGFFPTAAASSLGFNTISDRNLGRVLRGGVHGDGRRYELYYFYKGEHVTTRVQLIAHAAQAVDNERDVQNGTVTKLATGYTTQSGVGRRATPSGLPAGSAS